MRVFHNCLNSGSRPYEYGGIGLEPRNQWKHQNLFHAGQTRPLSPRSGPLAGGKMVKAAACRRGSIMAPSRSKSKQLTSPCMSKNLGSVAISLPSPASIPDLGWCVAVGRSEGHFSPWPLTSGHGVSQHFAFCIGRASAVMVATSDSGWGEAHDCCGDDPPSSVSIASPKVRRDAVGARSTRSRNLERPDYPVVAEPVPWCAVDSSNDRSQQRVGLSGVRSAIETTVART